MKGFVFVTGLRKSGTSMVKALLDGHPDVFMFPANEFELFNYTEHHAIEAAKFVRGPNLNRVKEYLATNDFIVRLNRKTVGVDDYRTTIDVAGFQRDLRSAKVTTYPELVQAVFRTMAANCSYFEGDIDNVHWGCKCVLNSEYVPEVLSWFPTAKFVYVLRNPYGHFDSIRTVSRRVKKDQPSYEGMRRSQLWNTYPILGIEMRRMMMSYYFMRKWRSLYPDNFYVLVYDRVLEAPHAEMEQLARFLGITFDECLVTPTIGGLSTVGNSSKGKQFDGINKDPASHWRSTITAPEIRLINEYFGDVIEEFGFERIESQASIWRPFQVYERPATYLVNRLLFKVKSWFVQIPEWEQRGVDATVDTKRSELQPRRNAA